MDHAPRITMLRTMDMRWQRHLALDMLREGIGHWVGRDPC
jgi:hypothetical protein